MSTTSPAVQHPYGLPMGTVRGFMSLLICSFFWIFLLLPEPPLLCQDGSKFPGPCQDTLVGRIGDIREDRQVVGPLWCTIFRERKG